VPVRVFAHLPVPGMDAVVPAPVRVAIALIAGALVAAEVRIPAFACGALFAVAALAMGMDSGVEGAPRDMEMKSLMGTCAGLVVGLTNVTLLVALIAEKKKQWMSIALRVAGSWIVAISLLMLACC
jgi:hydrogenase/urease accessory protein HupE